MASLRDIRRKIGTVKNINKITQAMKMVAAAKLRRAQERVGAARPYAEKMRELIDEVAPQVPVELIRRQPLLQSRESERLGLVVISSDRGLCGSYNNNVIRRGQDFIKEKQAEGLTVELITIGRKATNVLRTRGFAPSQSFQMIDVDSPYAEVKVITEAVVGLYTRAEDPVGEVWVAYTEFVNAVTQRPVIDRFLPIATGSVMASGDEADEQRVEWTEDWRRRLAASPGWRKLAASRGYRQLSGLIPRRRSADGSRYEFDPGAEVLLETLLPRFVDNQVYQYLLEATASEYGARMTAMSKASDNAAELIDTLTLAYNRARQDAITKEILDIVGGAEALAGE